MWDRRSLRYRDGQIEAPAGGSPDGAARIVLLIHGYNNDKEQADQSYAALSLNLGDEHVRLNEQVWKFYWPSYVEPLTSQLADTPIGVLAHHRADGAHSNSALSGLSYPLQVLKARRVGLVLGRFLRNLQHRVGVPTEVVFVAHSLGCRVVLEALRYMVRAGSVDSERQRIPAICLMAAAVPSFMVEPDGRLEGAALLPRTSYVLHSESDWVLRFTFPGGQWLASRMRRFPQYRDADPQEPDGDDNEGRLPEAVGRHGNPGTTWLRRGNTGLGHSDYWAHPATAPAVLRVLGQHAPRELRPFAGLQGVSWTLPSRPELPDWSLRSRQVERRLPERPGLR
jgi:hypothetical protein